MGDVDRVDESQRADGSVDDLSIFFLYLEVGETGNPMMPCLAQVHRRQNESIGDVHLFPAIVTTEGTESIGPRQDCHIPICHDICIDKILEGLRHPSNVLLHFSFQSRNVGEDTLSHCHGSIGRSLLEVIIAIIVFRYSLGTIRKFMPDGNVAGFQCGLHLLQRAAKRP